MAKTIDELRARLDEISERMQELSPEGSETRSLEEAEQTEFDTLDTEATEVERSIEQIEKRAERLKTLVNRGASERGSDRGPAFHKKTENIFDLDEIRMSSNAARTTRPASVTTPCAPSRVPSSAARTRKMPRLRPRASWTRSTTPAATLRCATS